MNDATAARDYRREIGRVKRVHGEDSAEMLMLDDSRLRKSAEIICAAAPDQVCTLYELLDGTMATRLVDYLAGASEVVKAYLDGRKN